MSCDAECFNDDLFLSDHVLLSNEAFVPGRVLDVGSDGVDEVDEQGAGAGDRDAGEQGAVVGDRDAGDDDHGDACDRCVAVAGHGVQVHSNEHLVMLTV